MFRLPTYQELSREQDQVYNLPASGNHLVVGPPGTGKTVVAVYRAEMLQHANQVAQFVVYNNTLKQYLETVLNEKKLDNITSTFHTWFPKWYRDSFGELPPQLEQFKYDWNAIYTMIGKKGINKHFPNLIIDEGQDFPKELYMVMRLMVENLTVFADENQRIWDTNSTINDIEQAIGVKQVHTLHKNYRNTRPIAEFASHFYTGLRSGIPELPDRKGIRPRLVNASEEYQIKLIINYANNNPDKEIGVIVQYKDQLKWIYDAFTHRIKGRYQMYFSDERAHRIINFSVPGIKLITYASAKGLEFDTVFLPCINKIRTDSNLDELKMKFYVLASRAREELFMLTACQEVPFFMQHIPNNLYEKIKATPSDKKAFH